MDGGEGDGLGPPVWIGAVRQKAVDELLVEPALGHEPGAQLGDRMDPVGGPGRATIVDGSLSRARDLLESQRREARGQGAADVVVDALGSRPSEPAVPEGLDLGRLGDADGEKSGSISRILPPGAKLATMLRIAASASATWCSTARAVTRSKPPGSIGPAQMSALRSLRLGAATSISDRSRSTATTLPPGPTRSASQAEIEPSPQPTSSARAPGPTPSCAMCRRCIGSSSRDINASRARSPSRW